MESSIENDILTGAQRRTLSISLQLLEEGLFFIQLLASNGKYKGELFSLEVDLDKEQLRCLNEVIKKILSRIHYLKEKFNLNGRAKRLSRATFTGWKVISGRFSLTKKPLS